jgi:hypothetical protein
VLVSEVNATLIPSPYRHQTKSGSPASLARMNSLVGFGRVIKARFVDGGNGIEGQQGNDLIISRRKRGRGFH